MSETIFFLCTNDSNLFVCQNVDLFSDIMSSMSAILVSDQLQTLIRTNFLSLSLPLPPDGRRVDWKTKRTEMEENIAPTKALLSIEVSHSYQCTNNSFNGRRSSEEKNERTRLQKELQRTRTSLSLPRSKWLVQFPFFFQQIEETLFHCHWINHSSREINRIELNVFIVKNVFARNTRAKGVKNKTYHRRIINEPLRSFTFSQLTKDVDRKQN